MTPSLFRKIEFLDSVDSTNDFVKQFAGDGVPRAVLAYEQTAGRGRHGRSWYSAPGLGLYLSYLLFPRWTAEKAVILNRVSAMAVAETILSLESEAGLELTFKEPNDVLIRGRKVCGILVETSTLQDRLTWAIAGIGLNLSHAAFPDQSFRLPPTSLRKEGVRYGDAISVFQTLTQSFVRFYRWADQDRQDRLSQSADNLFDRVTPGHEDST